MQPRYDMHIHAHGATPDPDKLLAEMEVAGIHGGCVFSTWPVENKMKGGLDFDARLKECLGWAREGRIFPVMWINPYEKDIISKVKTASDAGVMAFKFICSGYYVYEDACIALLKEISKLGRPAIFHSGILWDGQVSSCYNRPVNWESLLQVDGLRFSMGHCSWPWIDECIALYGKFLNALTTSDSNPEMFFDITPGTPRIYREELLTKLYTIGYDVPDNIMFGTDSAAEGYTKTWTGGWMDVDDAIYAKLGVDEKLQDKLYHDNLFRFLGITPKTFTHLSPADNDSHAWHPGMER